MPLPVGADAPDPLVFPKPREPVRLRELARGEPLVLLFFPLAFSSTCTREMCEVAEDHAAYQELGARVVGVSVDSPYVNLRFAEECGASYAIVSDFNREASRGFEVLREDLGGLKDVSERAAFVLDRTWRVVYVWQGEHPGVYPPLEEIKDAVRALQ